MTRGVVISRAGACQQLSQRGLNWLSRGYRSLARKRQHIRGGWRHLAQLIGQNRYQARNKIAGRRAQAPHLDVARCMRLEDGGEIRAALLLGERRLIDEGEAAFAQQPMRHIQFRQHIKEARLIASAAQLLANLALIGIEKRGETWVGDGPGAALVFQRCRAEERGAESGDLRP